MVDQRLEVRRRCDNLFDRVAVQAGDLSLDDVRATGRREGVAELGLVSGFPRCYITSGNGVCVDGRTSHPSPYLIQQLFQLARLTAMSLA